MTEYIHGGTDAIETARLEKQAQFLSRWILDGVEVGPGGRVLDLACARGSPTCASSAAIWRSRK